MENWKDIPDYENFYEVSCRGNIRNKRTGKILSNNSKTYVCVMLFKGKDFKRFLAHRIVANAFIPNPLNKREVNHINGIKNDNRIENLEWCTPSENVNHSWRIGTSKTTDGMRKAGKELWASGTQGMFVKKPVLDKSTGIVYSSRRELSEAANISVGMVRYWIKKGIYESIENV
jgi:hypothetical protein